MQSTSSVPVLFPNFLSHIDASQVVSVLLALLFIVWAVYTIVASYHWLRYGHNSTVAIPALVVHIAMSGYLALFAISGFS
ncbi:MAG: hypothetical protein ACEQSB_06920, partial [Undibacterium sp.]